MSKQILFLVAFFAASTALFADASAVGRSRNGYPLIIPQPHKLAVESGSFTLPARLTVSAPKELDLAPLAKICRETAKEIEILPADGRALCRFELNAAGVPDFPEGYTLAVSGDGIVAKARNLRGLYCAMQTLGWILRSRSTPDSIPNCAITDWPDLEMRGIYLQLSPLHPSKVDRICHVIDTLGTLKYNTLLINFADNFPFSGDPFVKREFKLSRDDVAKIVAAAKRNQMEIIPKLQILSHASWMMNHRDWQKFYEGEPKKIQTVVYCLSAPEIQPAIEQVVRETADLVKPRYFHLGLDEILHCGFPMCPKCKSADLTELIVKHVKPLKQILDERGITTIVYHDDFFGSDNPGSPDVSPIAQVPDRLGRDIMINSWEYQNVPTAAMGKKIRACGFDKLIYMSFAISPGNCRNLPRIAFENKAKGNILAYWSMVPVTLDRHDGSIAAFYTSTLLQANSCWNTNDADLADLPIDTPNILRELLDGRPDRAFCGKAAPVALSGLCNSAFANHPLFPKFDAKLAAATRQAVSADQTKFALTTEGGTVDGIALSGMPDDGLPKKSVAIPIGTTASGASFLTTAAAFHSGLISTYDSCTKFFQVGSFKVIYADGGSDEIPLVFQRSIADWNQRIAGTVCRSVVRGSDADGSLFHFTALDWRNPHKEKPIREIVFSSKGNTQVAPVLLALSLSDVAAAPTGVPGAPKIADAPAQTAPPKYTPIADFRNGIPKKGRPQAVGVTDFKCSVVNDHELGKVLEFTIPATTKRLSRVLIDLPIEHPQEFRSVVFSVKVSNPDTISRPDFYVMNWKASKVLDVLGYTQSFTPDRWQNICLPRERFAKKDGGGIEPKEAECIRVGFFLHQNAKPTKIQVSNISFCDRMLSGRSNLSVPKK